MAAPPEGQNCANCFFFILDDAELSTVVGSCRFNAPASVAANVTEKGAGMPVDPDFWCADWGDGPKLPPSLQGPAGPAGPGGLQGPPGAPGSIIDVQRFSLQENQHDFAAQSMIVCFVPNADGYTVSGIEATFSRVTLTNFDTHDEAMSIILLMNDGTSLPENQFFSPTIDTITLAPQQSQSFLRMPTLHFQSGMTTYNWIPEMPGTPAP